MNSRLAVLASFPAGVFLFAVVAAGLPASPLRAAGGIQWEKSLDAALAKAKAENIPVFIAVNMDGERVCEELCEKHYRDPRIVKLSGHMACLFASKYAHRGGDKVCPRAGTIPCAVHRQVEMEVRQKVLGIPAGEEVIAPDHIWLGPDGKIILSVPYMITKGELEWCMAEAARKVDPSFRWSLSPAARAPRRVLFGKAAATPGGGGKGGRGGKAKPLGKKELAEVLDAVRKGSGRGERWRTVSQYFPSLIVTEDKEAMKTVERWLSSRWAVNGDRGARLIHDIGRFSPPSFWKVAAPFVSHSSLTIRNEAIVALEELAAPKSLKVLLKQRSAEKDERTKGNLIRAIASAGRADRSAESLVLKAAEKDRSLFLRINALIGLVYVENRDKVNDALLKSLGDKDPGVRAAAAYTIAVRREEDLKEALRIALETEKDARCRTYLEAAAAALEGGSLKLVEGVLRDYARDEIPRDRE